MKEAFECKECGKCCFGYGGARIDDDKAEEIANFLNMKKEDFIKDFCVKVSVSSSEYYIAQKEDGFCLFYKDKLCQIHPVKPKMCKDWPFLEAVIKDSANWDIMANSCEGINKDFDKDELVKIIKKYHKR